MRIWFFVMSIVYIKMMSFSRANLAPLEWLQGIDLSKAHVEDYQLFGKTRTRDDCSLVAGQHGNFQANAFVYTESYDCILLKIDVDQDFEKGTDAVFVLDGPWTCPDPYYCN